jgi:hypothetical protein
MPNAMEPIPEPTVEQMTDWDEGELLAWIQKKREKLLKDENKLEALKKAKITGEVFWTFAGNEERFETKFNLHPSISVMLANLSREFKEGVTAGIKSMFTIFIHAHYKLTTSQKTDSRPKMWRCPTPPV